jgi:Ser-tRNA(Ala) deacylase AlaX
MVQKRRRNFRIFYAFYKKGFSKGIYWKKKLQNQINNKLSMYTNQKHTFLHLCRAAIPQINSNLPSVL